MGNVKCHRKLSVILCAVLGACGGSASTTSSVEGPSVEASHSLSVSWGTVNEPSLPATVCATLSAALVPANGSLDAVDTDPTRSQPDQTRIQSAIDACPSGQSVKLAAAASGASGFLSGPLKLKSGVTLWVDAGVTLFASRNPADYDKGSGTCGTATVSDTNACNPLLLADGTTGSGIVGDGAIDGRGGSVLTNGPNAGVRSWWDVAWQNKSQGLFQQNPLLIQVNNGSSFTLYRVAVLNAPTFHVLTSGVSGVTAWGVKIVSPTLVYSKPGYACPADSTPDKVTPATCFTPETVKNTDGFDPAQSSEVLLAYSFISVGDDNVAVKSHGRIASSHLALLHNHFYYGHGLSIGSETDSGLSDMLVEDLAVDGFDSAAGIGLRIKSDASRGGHVDGVTYRDVCMRNVRQPLVFDSYYRPPDSGSRYPLFTNITVSGMHSLGSVKYGAGEVTFAGFDAAGQKNPLSIALDNVVLDGGVPTFAAGHNGSPGTLPAATHFTLGPGAVSFASSLQDSEERDVTVGGSAGISVPVNCDHAFVPLVSALAGSPI